MYFNIVESLFFEKAASVIKKNLQVRETNAIVCRFERNMYLFKSELKSLLLKS